MTEIFKKLTRNDGIFPKNVAKRLNDGICSKIPEKDEKWHHFLSNDVVSCEYVLHGEIDFRSKELDIFYQKIYDQ